MLKIYYRGRFQQSSPRVGSPNLSSKVVGSYECFWSTLGTLDERSAKSSGEQDGWSDPGGTCRLVPNHRSFSQSNGCRFLIFPLEVHPDVWSRSSVAFDPTGTKFSGSVVGGGGGRPPVVSPPTSSLHRI